MAPLLSGTHKKYGLRYKLGTACATSQDDSPLFTTMFFDAPGPEASLYNDGDNRAEVLLTFSIFFSFVVVYLTAGIVWSLAVTALAVALSLCYLRARRRRRAAAVVRVSLASRSNGGGLDPAVLPAFAYKRLGWAQCVICLGIVRAGEVVRQLPACKHLFHMDCIDAWLHSHSTCPICRAVVVQLTVGLPSAAEPV